jgi:hypothetical protein
MLRLSFLLEQMPLLAGNLSLLLAKLLLGLNCCLWLLLLLLLALMELQMLLAWLILAQVLLVGLPLLLLAGLL